MLKDESRVGDVANEYLLEEKLCKKYFFLFGLKQIFLSEIVFNLNVSWCLKSFDVLSFFKKSLFGIKIVFGKELSEGTFLIESIIVM